MAILNWDAHADVRELNEGLGHSESPFRQALEHSSVEVPTLVSFDLDAVEQSVAPGVSAAITVWQLLRGLAERA